MDRSGLGVCWQICKRSAPAQRARGEKMEARRAKTGRSQGLVHDSCPRRREPAKFADSSNAWIPLHAWLTARKSPSFFGFLCGLFRTLCACHDTSGGTSLQAGLPFLVITKECPCCRSFMTFTVWLGSRCGRNTGKGRQGAYGINSAPRLEVNQTKMVSHHS